MLSGLRKAVLDVYGKNELSSWLDAACERTRIDRDSARNLWVDALDRGVEDLALYLHVPWCASRCRYCMYRSSVPRTKDDITGYVNSLTAEMSDASGLFEGREFSSFYMGGGTVTVLAPTDLDVVLGVALGRFEVAASGERTMEANPASCTLEHLDVAHGNGINRVSIGIQTFDRSTLSRYGREPVDDEALGSLVASSRRFDVVNMDLIVGLAGQDRDSFRSDLDRVVAHRPDEIHCYRYQPPPGEKKGKIDYHEEGARLLADRPGGYDVDVNEFRIALHRPGCHQFSSGYSLYDYPGRSTLGFGRWSVSRICGTGEYRDEGSRLSLSKYPDEFEKFRFVADRLERVYGIPLGEYEALFDEPFSRRFEREIEAAIGGGLIESSQDDFLPVRREVVPAFFAGLLPTGYGVAMMSDADTGPIRIEGDEHIERLLTPLFADPGDGSGGQRPVAFRLTGGSVEIEVTDSAGEGPSCFVCVGRSGHAGKALASAGEFDVWYMCDGPAAGIVDLCEAVASRLGRHRYDDFWRYLVAGAWSRSGGH